MGNLVTIRYVSTALYGIFTRATLCWRGLCDSDVSVRPSVRHTPVLCLAQRKKDREMYTT